MDVSTKPAVCTSEQQNHYDLKMATADYSETSIPILQNTRRHIQKHNSLDARCREHPRFYTNLNIIYLKVTLQKITALSA
jgi:hypothetical protein